MLVVGLTVPWTAPALANTSGNQIVGGFEIDGNFYEGFDNNTTATGPDGDPVDWGSDDIYPDDVDLVQDPFLVDDPSIYDQGSKEEDPDDWKDAASAQPPNKGDVGNVYVYDRLVGNDQYVFLAFERATDNGTVTYYLELNQLPNTENDHRTPIPDRTAGDIRLTIENQGSGNFQVIKVEEWNGSTWVDAGVQPGDVVEAINDSTINVPGGTRLEDEFGEFGFNLTALGLELGCPSTGFNTLNLRSKAGNAQSNAELKDYATGDIDIPARCSAIRIKKKDPEGNLLGGATFTIEPDPTPGSNAPSLSVTDGGANDPDGTADGVIVIDPADPDTYTITETSPPPGYIQTTAPKVGDADAFDTLTVVFENRLGTLTWQKVDEENEELVCCATFEVEGTAGAADGDQLTVVDNGENDTDPAEGVIKVEGLKTGTYSVTETVPPVGYDLPDNPTRTGIVIDSDNPDVTIGEAFEDPRIPSELSVLKLDADTDEPLAGATFELFLDDDGVAGPSDGDTSEGQCTTGADGTCTIGDLDWGTYYWYEVSAPTGYELPADRYSGLIVINRDNAGSEFEAAEFEDPQIRSALKIVKKDATTEDKLAGASFVVRLDDGDGVFETGDDAVVDPPGEVTTDGSGKVIVDNLPFGTYWVEETAAPTGYELPSPAYQGPYTFDASNAGETIKVIFEDPQIRTDLSVQKLDQTSEDPLGGATFELYLDDGDGVPDGGDTLIGECTTGDDQGVCTITDLQFGDYYWKETVAPPGYDLPADPYSVIITINAANAGTEIAPISFFDPRRPGELTVLKVDDTDDEPLAGAEFDLVLDDGDGTYEADQDTVVGTCVTNASGTCSIGDLDFGTYFWVETAAPTGYELPDDPVSGPIVISAGNVDDEPTPIEFRDPRLPSELSVMKLDAVDDEPLAGAEFDLVLDDGDGTYEPGDDAVVDSCTTGADGTCTIGDLDFGTYFWVETAAPSGYELPEDPVSGPVVINAGNAGTETSATVFRDPRVLSELTVRKVDDVDDSPLAGAIFLLVRDDGDGVAEEDEDEVLEACLTDADGLCTATGLDFGTYYWVETDPPVGYDLPDNPVSDMVTINAGNAGTEFAVITFRDPRAPSELTVLKLAEDTEEPLAGAKFELYLDDGDGVGDAPDEGDVLVNDCTTGDDGTCTIGDLDFGDYYWYETEAPEGYIIPEDATSEIISITAENAGTAMDPVVFVDPPVDTPPPPPPTKPPGLPITGTSLGLIGLALALLVTGGVILAMNHRRNPVRGTHRA
jgi:uncharacterized surface anchored protein